MKEIQFVDDFYCRACGSTTALHIRNLWLVRYMGCDTYYEKGDTWVVSQKPILNPNEPPRAKQDKR